jgi:hypothetical protein
LPEKIRNLVSPSVLDCTTTWDCLDNDGFNAKLLTIAPIFNWPLIENSDQFARQVGLFAKGKYGKEYRMSYKNRMLQI